MIHTHTCAHTQHCGFQRLYDVAAQFNRHMEKHKYESVCKRLTLKHSCIHTHTLTYSYVHASVCTCTKGKLSKSTFWGSIFGLFLWVPHLKSRCIYLDTPWHFLPQCLSVSWPRLDDHLDPGILNSCSCSFYILADKLQALHCSLHWACGWV